MVVGRQDLETTVRRNMSAEFDQELEGFFLVQLEELPRDHRIGIFKVVSGKFLLLQKPHLPVRIIVRPSNIIDAVYSLQVGANPVEPIGEFDGNRIEIDAATLLEIGELRNLESIQQYLPADSPRTQRGRFPVIFLKADVVIGKAQSDGG